MSHQLRYVISLRFKNCMLIINKLNHFIVYDVTDI